MDYLHHTIFCVKTLSRFYGADQSKKVSEFPSQNDASKSSEKDVEVRDQYEINFLSTNDYFCYWCDKNFIAVDVGD